MRAVYARLEGHFTFVVIHHDEPDRLVGVRRQTPLVVGLGDGENFLASNLAAFLAETRRVAVPGRRRDRRGHAARACASSAPTTASPVELEVHEIDWDEEVAERDGLRDVHAQGDLRAARGLRETIGDRVRHGVPRAGRPRA